MFHTAVHVHIAVLVLGARLHAAVTRLQGERGQTSAEYALVLLGAASVAVLVAVWARSTGQVGKLLDTIFGSVTRMARG